MQILLQFQSLLQEEWSCQSFQPSCVHQVKHLLSTRLSLAITITTFLDIVQTRGFFSFGSPPLPSTLATITSMSPALLSVSMMQTASISSVPWLMGMRTLFLNSLSFDEKVYFACFMIINWVAELKVDIEWGKDLDKDWDNAQYFCI